MQRARDWQLRRFRFDRRKILAKAVRRLSRRKAPGRYSTLWTDAIYGWGNELWAAESLYLAEVVRSAERATGSILECGSGLTTLLMSAVSGRRGIQLHSLEHDATWHAKVVEALRETGAPTATVHLAALRDYGEFDWYDVPLDDLPADVSLVICDGPPSGTRGGRSGMLPSVRSRMAPVCVVLLDDANRPAERQLVQEWSREAHTTPEINTSSRGFARVTVHGE